MLTPAVLAAGGAIAAVGLLAVIGWAFGLPELTAWRAGTIPMAPVTALLTVLAGGVLATRVSARSRRGDTAAVVNGVVAVTAMGLLIARLRGVYFPIEHLGIPITGTLGALPVGYASPVTLAAYLLLAVAIGIQTTKPIDWRIRLAVSVTAGAVIALVGYAFLLTTLFGPPLLSALPVVPVAINSSVALMLCGTALSLRGATLTHKSRNALIRDRSWRPLIGLFVVVVLITLTGSYAYYRQEEGELRSVAMHQLPLSALHGELWSRLRWVMAFVGAVVFGAASTLALIWRNQRVAHYRHEARLANALRAQATRVADLVNHSPTILYTLINDGGWLVPVAVSHNIERLLGYSVPEVLDRYWWSTHVHPDDRRQAIENLSLLQTQDGFTHDFRFVRKDGTVLWVRDELNVTKREQGVAVEVSGAWHDITRQREADELLRNSERSARLQAAALRAAANAIVITSRDGSIDWVNPAFCALTGYRAEEVIGKNPRELVRSGAHGRVFYETMWDTIVAGRVWEGEITNRRKDGSTYVEHQTITPVIDSSGQISHFIGVKRDLTNEKRLQEQFLQAQKMEVVGRLAGGIAHDFNNLLTVINGESDLALADLPAGHPLREPLASILDAGQRAARLTSQLLAFSRKRLSSPSVVSVGAQIAEFLPMLRRLMGEDIALSLTLPTEGQPDHVNIDRSHLEQVILNLAVNARDAMPGGGAVKIAVSVTADARVSIAVTDTGTGIAPEIRARLFEPFFTTKAQGKGTGLGLSTVYSIVTQNGGTIDVASELGHGATFTVRWPVATRALAPEMTRDELASTTGETIVLVEDERDIRELATRMLRSAGYAVIPMETGAAALEWFQKGHRPVQLLMSDVVMPGMTGPELAAAIAQLDPDVPVLYASGYADDKLVPEALADPDHFIAKPYTTSTLVSRVRRILDAATHH